MNIHKNTRLTPLQRKEVWEYYKRGMKPKDLHIKFNVSLPTIYKIIKRARTQEFLPRNSINNRFRNIRRGLLRLAKIESKIIEKKNKEARRYNKNYPGEMMHFDTKKLPLIRGAANKKSEYLFVGIDDYSRELYVAIMQDKTQVSSSMFLRQVIDECPYTIECVYSDNGVEYKGNDKHEFVKECVKSGIKQKFTKVRTPRTNGKAERVIRTLIDMWHSKEVFKSSEHRKMSLKRFVNRYNTVKPHKGLDNKTPYEVIEKFYYG
ncbi:integrase core domain-containing protein [Candidatus Absconditicoccus praedator]|uniref:integrase core domain-containing protein n=1 Tax=Candidatus Absconditicoccus praedator TaxID=2735562 RepID=UPI001E53F6E8|nr:integrase core domain-containing protein [Candidatus Absconditicoccus praedator]UFX82553.1 transposase family protein [Candidatus Absconditicoccus praedator]UFX82558.1 transposase family protein [Candidatus Absconditicoccus praedator]UFX82617.1 transposase family protein [Candidatus Absconditicoccus praedator]UFX82658.1 transposase family protein [Candidatus Absconditicoccus praedator]UFX82961.1 transposase family protein [Candidatus Absconditicoccus praedator]